MFLQLFWIKLLAQFTCLHYYTRFDFLYIKSVFSFVIFFTVAIEKQTIETTLIKSKYHTFLYIQPSLFPRAKDAKRFIAKFDIFYTRFAVENW